MRDGVIAPHLLPDENLFRVVGKPVVLDASGLEIEPGSWFAPAGVDIQCAFEVTNFKDALDQCGLTSNDALEVVVQVAGREVRSRYTVTRKVLRRSGTIQIGGAVPYGHTDELMKMTVTVQLKNTSKASTPAPNKPGAILWTDEKSLHLGQISQQLRVMREEMPDRQRKKIPWFVEIDMVDLERAFTEAVVVRVNSAHPLGAQIDTNARGTKGTFQRDLRMQMYADIERQLLHTALHDENIRTRQLVKEPESLGDVLRYRIAIARSDRDPESLYRQLLRDPVSVELDMNRVPYDA